MLRLISRNDGGELPLPLADLLNWLKRTDTDEDDDVITACLRAAIAWAEGFTGLITVDSTFDLFIDNFPTTGAIYFRRGPLLEVQSVNYRDVSGAEVTMSSSGYLVDSAGYSIYLAPTGTWPSTDGGLNAVRIRFRVGFIEMTGSPTPDGDIPEDYKLALKLTGAKFYANREDMQRDRAPYEAEVLLRRYRIDDSLA